MLRSEVIRAMVEPHIKAAVQVLADLNQTNESAVLRLAARHYTEIQIADLERRIAAAEQFGQTDVTSEKQLQALRAAYASPSEN